jgi:hypothetical protein
MTTTVLHLVRAVRFRLVMWRYERLFSSWRRERYGRMNGRVRRSF